MIPNLVTEEDFEKFKCFLGFKTAFLGSKETVEKFKEWALRDIPRSRTREWYATSYPVLANEGTSLSTSDIFVIFPDYPHIDKFEDSLKDYIQIC